MNVIFGEIFPEVLLAFTRPECARIFTSIREANFCCARAIKLALLLRSGLNLNEPRKVAAAANPQSKITAASTLYIAYLVWEILRLRRSKAAITNLAFRDALTEVVAQLLRNPGERKYQQKDHAEKLAREWFSDPDVKKQIAGLFQEFKLDETAIEAEASENQAMTSSASTTLWLQQKPAATRRPCA